MNLSSYLKELFIDFVKSDILHIQMSMSIHRKRILEMLLRRRNVHHTFAEPF